MKLLLNLDRYIDFQLLECNHFLGKDVHKVISSRENPGAYYVQKVGSDVIETPLDTTILD